ncbi:MAG: type II toxin-antitoxin system RelE/ParE family toxin [Myxococcales bacterium]|nr:type II toxin-antitoxin system RelE/ParE family toxin [Myxococcales bacterium]
MAPTRRPRIVWAAPALDELDEVAAWISADDPATAARLVRRVFAGLERASRHPRLGRYVPEAPGKTYRELIVPPLRVVYRPAGSDLLVVCVIRSARELAPWLLR